MSLYLSLSRLRRSLVRFFIPVERPTIPLVFEFDGNTYAIHSWAKYINLAEARECFVVAVDHRRTHTPKSSDHEFLVITLWHPHDLETTMIAERSIIFESNSSTTLSPSPGIPVNPPPSPVVKDRIRFSPCPKNSHSIACWLFHDIRPTVADLCAILYVVSVHLPSDHPHENQSSWFSQTAYGVLTKEYPGAGRVNRQATYLESDMDSEPTIRNKYRSVWGEFIERTTAEREAQYLEQARAKGLEEGREEGRAAARAESEAERSRISAAS